MIPDNPSSASNAGQGPTAEAVPAKEVPLEMAHVLFMDIVGYSRMPMEDQREVIAALKDAVQAAAEVKKAEANQAIIKLPTGDGMALVCFGDPEAPAKCAVELSRALRQHQLCSS